LGKDVTVSEDLRGNGLWIVESGIRHTRKMKKTAPRKLADLLLNQLEARPSPLGLLADVCSIIFEAPAWPGQDDGGRREGIWVDARMADFQCRQCGRCCRELNFRHQLLETDYQCWIQSGRNDILEWVAVHRRGGKIISFSIWVVPGTLTFAAQCPWLRKTDIEGLWRCDIHDVKPEICRQYPGTRKHARMTGCSAFQ
jgi:Fe-S-cluster containining protein